MEHSISKEFNFKELLKFSIPPMMMMVFISMYSMVDGGFVSRFVSTDALSAVSMVMPVNTLVMGISIMFGMGGCAVVSNNLGEGKRDLSNKNFTMFVVITLIFSILIMTCVLVFIDPIIKFVGADDIIFPFAKSYLSILALFMPMFALQVIFQNFFISAGNPTLGFLLTFSAGIFNIVFDYIFIVPMNMGIAGAALATGLGYCIPAIGGIIFFIKNKNGLHFTKFKFDVKIIIQGVFNGSSEMVSCLSGILITLIFNLVMMHYLGSDGVSAITIVIYSQFLFSALHIGFSIGVAPIISYHHGANNKVYLKKLLKICLSYTAIASIIIFVFAIIIAPIVIKMFTGDSQFIYEIASNGMRLFAISFLFSGINILTSALFTALNDGKTSAFLSFSRTFIFNLLGIFIFVYFMGYQGLFLAIPFAEVVTVIFAIILLRKLKKSNVLEVENGNE